MKKFTIIFCSFLVLALTAMLIYVAVSDEFIQPEVKKYEQPSEDNPIWGKTLDDVSAYLQEKGVLKKEPKITPLSKGIATEAYIYEDIELYWWDLKNIDKDGTEWEKYQYALKNGSVEFAGSEFNMTIRGPFGLGSLLRYMGDPDKLIETFHGFCAENIEE